MRTDILGVGFDNVTMDEAVARADALMKSGTTGHYVVTPNPEIVMACRRDETVRAAISAAALVLPDGIGVLYGAKILGRPLKEKTPGIDFGARLLALLAGRGGRVFLLGAAPGVAEAAGGRLAAAYPGLQIAGTADGYFDDSAAMVDTVNAARPDLLLVCLGAPKQELWMAENAPGLRVPLMAGLGGALDVFSGTVRRAPGAWQRLNLEWLYRLLTNPRRIKRMLRLPLFIFAVIGQKIKGES